MVRFTFLLITPSENSINDDENAKLSKYIRDHNEIIKLILHLMQVNM